MSDTEYAEYSIEWKYEQLQAENAKLRAALKPFADEAQSISPHAEDTWFYYDGIRFGDLRAARAAMEKQDD